jgi:hypothetical protein
MMKQLQNIELKMLLPFRQRWGGELKASTAMDFCLGGCFWLGKPNFHNRRIHSAARINIGNLPGRQNIRYSYVTLTNNPIKYHNPTLPGG